jgi:hypothetical protein
MSNGLREDLNGGRIQGFAPSRIITITATSAWTPGDTDRAFRVGVAGNYFMNADSSHEATLVAGSITVLFNRGQTFTFDTTQEIEVM